MIKEMLVNRMEKAIKMEEANKDLDNLLESLTGKPYNNLYAAFCNFIMSDLI